VVVKSKALHYTFSETQQGETVTVTGTAGLTKQ
jgi:hypothetical protein